MREDAEKKVLLVEDQAIIALAQQRILERYGYAVTTAHSGEKALELAGGANAFDLILMDIDLGPGMDGTQAAERILEHTDVPLVFLSGHTEPEIVEKTERVTSYGYVVKNSGETVLIASMKMAFRLFEARQRERVAREELRTRNEFLRFFRVAIDGMSDYRISVLDREYRFRIASRHYLDAYNLTEDQIVGKTISAVMGEEVFRESIQPSVDRAFSGERVERSRWFDHPALELGNRFINVTYYPIRQEDGNVSAVVVVVRDITDQKNIEEALRAGEERFRTLSDDLPAMTCEYLPDSTLTYVNRAYADYHGLTREEMVGTRFLQYIPEEYRDAAQQTYLSLTPDRPLNVHTHFVYRDGEKRWQEWRDRAFFNDRGEAIRFQAIGLDMTDRKRMEEEVQALAEWRETLIKEVHHRIKNTMSTMVSMLSLQAETVHDAGALDVINDATSRFQAMEVLYDELYQNASVDAGTGAARAYLEKLVTMAISLFPRAETVTVHTEIEEVQLDTKRLSALGIIMNELVTNAMKYAFSDRYGGVLSVVVGTDNTGAEVSGDGFLVVTVEDDGPGVPEAFDIDTSRRFGLALVRSLAEQLRGSIRIERAPRSRVIVRFPL